MRTKDDMIKRLAEKQTALKQAQPLAEPSKKVPATGGLQDLMVVELEEMAKAKGTFLNMTKRYVVDLLDELQAGADHPGLKDKTLIAPKKKRHIGSLKNKEQLIEVLQKAAGEEPAERAKQEAVEAEKKEAIKKVV